MAHSEASWRLGKPHPKFGRRVLTLGARGNGHFKMKRYWQFAVVGVICLLVALLWAQPPRSQAQTAVMPVAQRSGSKPDGGRDQAAQSPNGSRRSAEADDNDPALPGSNSSLPLLAVIGFGVLAGGITSAMRTR